MSKNIFVKPLHAKPWAEAQERAEVTLSGECTDEIRAQVEEALASHPGNPANKKPAPSAGAGPTLPVDPDAAKVAELKAKYGTKANVFTAIGKGEFNDASGNPNIDLMSKVLASFDAPRADFGPRNTAPLMRKDGKEHPLKDEKGVCVDKRPFRLCRREAGKVPMVYVEVCKKAEKGSHGKGVNMLLPHLQALVVDHGCNGVLKQALDAFNDGSICYSREKTD